VFGGCLFTFFLTLGVDEAEYGFLFSAGRLFMGIFVT